MNSAKKNKGRSWSEEEKKKLRGPTSKPGPLKGRKSGPRSEETKRKISETLKNKKHSQERIEKTDMDN